MKRVPSSGLLQRYARLARRERALVMAATLFAILGLGTVFVVEPGWQERTHLLRRMDQQRSELATLAPQVAALQARQRDPDAAVRAQLEVVRRELQLADGEFQALQRALVAPRDMGALLEGLLQSHGGLQLIGLRNLPVTSVAELLEPAARDAAGRASTTRADAPPPAPAKAAAPGADGARPARDSGWLYRHGVEITVQGRYADLVAYLEALERLPRRVYWGELRLEAQQWPASRMTVVLYTISLEKTWWRV